MQSNFKTEEEKQRAINLCKGMLRSKMYPEMNDWWKEKLKEIENQIPGPSGQELK